MRQYKRSHTPNNNNSNVKKPKLSTAAQKILERKKKNEQMLRQMETRIKGVTRNYDEYNSSTQKAKSENCVSNKVRYNPKRPGKFSNVPKPQSMSKPMNIGYNGNKGSIEVIKHSHNTSYSKDARNLTTSTMSKGSSKQSPSKNGIFNYTQDHSGVIKCKKKSPQQSLNFHHAKMHKKPNKKSSKFEYESIDKSAQFTQFAKEMDCEREAVVFCKRGEKKKRLMGESEASMSQGKQSLIDAKEPSIEVISTASYLKAQERSSDCKADFSYEVRNKPHIVNVYTATGAACFGKKFSNTRSTFLNEEEEADMLNVNEFSENELPAALVRVYSGNIINHQRVLKTLPITKESFLNWNKQSMLKSFATSQSASFISHRPTERIEYNMQFNEKVNPAEILRYEQQIVKREVFNAGKTGSSKKPQQYYESPEQVSTVFMDESSAFFEEYAPKSSFKEFSPPSSKKDIKYIRSEKLHNCNKVQDYDFIKAHKAKDSIIISRNYGDTGLVLKETMDLIENSENENYESSPEESKSIPVSSNCA